MIVHKFFYAKVAQKLYRVEKRPKKLDNDKEDEEDSMEGPTTNKERTSSSLIRDNSSREIH